ncbi:MAG: hypothetical protein QG576_980 [Bacteroidota bacterium]|nr:hypothetical protein [Bacteroidota bacterium]
MVYFGKSVVRDMYFGAKPELFRLAQKMRNKPTKAEKILWEKLKQFRKDGYTFRRQHPIDIFIVDFYCHKLKLVIEVDGEIHSGQQAQESIPRSLGSGGQEGVRPVQWSIDHHWISSISNISCLSKADQYFMEFFLTSSQ